MKRTDQWSCSESSRKSRREFLRFGGMLSAGAALAGVAVPAVHAAEDNTIRLALVGSGSRGSGAVGNAMSAPGGPVKLVAMADLFEQRLSASSHKTLTKEFGDRIDVRPGGISSISCSTLSTTRGRQAFTASAGGPEGAT